MSVNVQLKGLDEIARKLDNLQDFQRWAEPPMNDSIEAVHARVQTYPPPKPTYIRTFTLQRSIRKIVERLPDGLRGRVYSTGADQGRGPYEHFVKVRETQAWMHVGHWPTTEDDLTAEQSQIDANFKNAIDKVLK